ncbi:SRPBCC family protein [Sphingobacteruim zhuxiongii]|nr:MULTISPECIES: SRPBCC family protein [unclassified Sphingobacterium]
MTPKFLRNKYFHALVMPLVYALLMRLLFDLSNFSSLFVLMSISFLFLVPFVMGALTIYFSPIEQTRKNAYTLLAPYIPLTLFAIMTMILKLEGWACWMMAFPIFMIFSSIGGLVGKSFQKKHDTILVSLLVLLPLFSAPIESWIGSHKQTFKAYNYIDIEAPADKIWSLVTRVSKIKEEEDTGWLNKALGFPRPVEAELNYEGVGAYRKAIFTNGLVFHETVTHYAHQKSMSFSIKANPYEIPSTTLDEHVVVGGNFFDVLNGTYELEKLADDKYRLHLYSHFTLDTTFNFYAGIWARWIMQDIQRNILKVEKRRAEQS